MSGGHGRQCSHEAHGAHPDRTQEEKRLQEQLRNIKHKILVMSGKGGVGKTSVATYLALGLSKRGYQVGLLDADFHGPDIPRMLNISGMFEFDEEHHLIPHRYSDHLEVVSIECLLHDRDEAVIWRGPAKHGVIRQFVSDVMWGNLDVLIIDSPPGTGDEPLSVAQTITGAQAVIVTTPQEVSLADVRKAINFCRKVKMPILGLVENMSGLICPHCGKKIPLFSLGGGQKTATSMHVPLLASLPFDLRVMRGGDTGHPLLESPDDSPYLQAFKLLLNEVEERLKAHAETPIGASGASLSAAGASGASPSAEVMSTMAVPETQSFKVAVPLANGVLCNHFGHCEHFAVLDVLDGKIGESSLHVPPPHEPGVLPRWLGDLGVNLIIAGGMGQRALNLFSEGGIRVVIGAPNLEPETLVQSYLSGNLRTGPNVCDH